MRRKIIRKGIIKLKWKERNKKENESKLIEDKEKKKNWKKVKNKKKETKK